MVLVNAFDTRNVAAIPNRIMPVSSMAAPAEFHSPTEVPIKNMVIIDISVGNLPLHGTKLLVMIAMSRSRCESMIRQPGTPAALQPNPMHMVN